MDPPISDDKYGNVDVISISRDGMISSIIIVKFKVELVLPNTVNEIVEFPEAVEGIVTSRFRFMLSEVKSTFLISPD
jgi:hypothetical protein